MLKVSGLKTHFFTDTGVVKAVDGINLNMDEGETLGLVGESGCGKSVTALSLLRLIPSPPGKIVSGDITFKEKSLLKIPESEMRSIRGRDISIVFQEPMTALNPVFTVGNQIMEAIKVHQKLNKYEAKEHMLWLLETVGIPQPRERSRCYPHELSGGMRQRAMIAMALSCHPSLLIADEPTTALDVTIQAQILDLLRNLQNKFGMSILLITHDLGIVAEMADRVAVMYAGKIVESASAERLFEEPQHPYTQGLLKCLPRLDIEQAQLETIPGRVPDLTNLPGGCSFLPRCRLKVDACHCEFPPLQEISEGHQVACFVRNDGKHWNNQ